LTRHHFSFPTCLRIESPNFTSTASSAKNRPRTVFSVGFEVVEGIDEDGEAEDIGKEDEFLAGGGAYLR